MDSILLEPTLDGTAAGMVPRALPALFLQLLPSKSPRNQTRLHLFRDDLESAPEDLAEA